MIIRIREGDVEVTDALRVHVERRLRLALGRFGERIARVTVRLSSAEAGTLCRIDVTLRARRIRIEDIDADLFSAVGHAADRASRSVARGIEQERDAIG